MSAAGVVLISGDLVLLCKRAEFFEGQRLPYGGFWSPFAGAIEQGETPAQAAKRELYEESEIDLPIELFKFNKTILRTINEQYNKDFHLFVVELDSIPEVVLDEEHTEQGTFLIEHLHTIEPIDEEIIKVIKSYIKNRN